MISKVIVALMLLFGLPAAQGQTKKQPIKLKETGTASELERARAGAKKYNCITGTSYGGVEWNKEYPYPAQRTDDRDRVVYRPYKPGSEAEEEAAHKACQDQQQRYLAQFERGEERLRAESEKTIKASPAPKADVAKVVECMLRAGCAKWFSREVYKDGDVQVVFIYVHRRYTLYTTPRSDKNRWLSVWVRREGTATQADLENYSDYGLDGSVEHGNYNDGRRRFLQEKKELIGPEWRGFWQQRYNMSIGFILEYIASNPTKW